MIPISGFRKREGSHGQEAMPVSNYCSRAELLGRSEERHEGEVKIYNERVRRTRHVAAWTGSRCHQQRSHCTPTTSQTTTTKKNPNCRVRYNGDVPADGEAVSGQRRRRWMDGLPFLANRLTVLGVLRGGRAKEEGPSLAGVWCRGI